MEVRIGLVSNVRHHPHFAAAAAAAAVVMVVVMAVSIDARLLGRFLMRRVAPETMHQGFSLGEIWRHKRGGHVV